MELAYERRGSGSPLVLLHGIGHHWQAWLPVLDRLSRRHDVIAVDFPGFGASPSLPPGTPYTPETLGVAVESLWSRLGLEEPYVAGNSLGGYVALDLAARGAVRGAVAFSPAGFWSRAEHRYCRVMLKVLRAAAARSEQLQATAIGRAVSRSGLRVLVAHPERMPEDELLLGTQALRDAAGFDDTLAAFEWMPPPAPPKVPITIAWGEHDRLLPVRQAVRAGRWSQQRVTVLRGCGHVPMTDDPDLVADVILAATGG
ncbi:alpha/beta hydrolase [Streptosporangiaceae bacterium NEAU-GS5]|nr:alpha/beta hydrolase [Streptosporangiaceae bacterium NEAU-GS5]